MGLHLSQASAEEVSSIWLGQRKAQLVKDICAYHQIKWDFPLNLEEGIDLAAISQEAAYGLPHDV